MTLAEHPIAKKAHIWPRDPLDWYVEPQWCNERLFEMEKFAGVVWDPACGSGRILKAAYLAGIPTVASDVLDRGYENTAIENFLESLCKFSNIVSNPPYKIARPFIEHALKLASHKVAMLLPYGFMFGAIRGRWLESTPLARVLLLSPRPSMPPGHLVASGDKPSGGRVDFVWFIWDHAHSGPPMLGWCRK